MSRVPGPRSPWPRASWYRSRRYTPCSEITRGVPWAHLEASPTSTLGPFIARWHTSASTGGWESGRRACSMRSAAVNASCGPGGPFVAGLPPDACHPVQRLVGGERGAEVAGPCVVVEGAQGGHEGRGGPAGGGGVLPRRVRQGPEDVLVRLGERLGGRGPAR